MKLINWNKPIYAIFEDGVTSKAFIIGEYQDGTKSIGISNPDNPSKGLMLHIDNYGRSVETYRKIIENYTEKREPLEWKY